MRMSVVCFAVLSLGSSVSAQPDDDVHAVLAAYERVRAALANDRGGPVERAATRMATAATRAMANTTGAMQSKLRLVVARSRALASIDASDMRALRRAFGRVSEPLVAIVRASTRLRRDLHLFYCPMAEGYGEWIQPTDDIANPYMGQRMLQCGGGRDW